MSSRSITLVAFGVMALLAAGLWQMSPDSHAPKSARENPSPMQRAEAPPSPLRIPEASSPTTRKSVPKRLADAPAQQAQPPTGPGDGEWASSPRALEAASPTNSFAGRSSVDPAVRTENAELDPEQPVPGSEEYFQQTLEELGYEPDEIDYLEKAWRASKTELEYRFADVDPDQSRYLRDREKAMIRKDVYDELREELEPEDFEALIYAGGEPNRLEVSWVPKQSLMSEWGLRSGDQIVSVGGQKFSSRFEYTDWLREQERTGELVPVDIVRDGERIVLELPDGNLGVALKEVSGPVLD